MRTISGGWVSDTLVVTISLPSAAHRQVAEGALAEALHRPAGRGHREQRIARVLGGREVERLRVGAPGDRLHLQVEALRQLAGGAALPVVHHQAPAVGLVARARLAAVRDQACRPGCSAGRRRSRGRTRSSSRRPRRSAPRRCPRSSRVASTASSLRTNATSRPSGETAKPSGPPRSKGGTSRSPGVRSRASPPSVRHHEQVRALAVLPGVPVPVEQVVVDARGRGLAGLVRLLLVADDGGRRRLARSALREHLRRHQQVLVVDPQEARDAGLDATVSLRGSSPLVSTAYTWGDAARGARGSRCACRRGSSAAGVSPCGWLVSRRGSPPAVGTSHRSAFWLLAPRLTVGGHVDDPACRRARPAGRRDAAASSSRWR